MSASSLQDQWRIKRLTLNYGARFDYWNSYVPPQDAGPGPNVPTAMSATTSVPNVPIWKNVTPRLGRVLRLCSATARRPSRAASASSCSGRRSSSFTRAANPVAATITSATRPILNGSFTPNCDFTNLGPERRLRTAQQREFRQAQRPPRATTRSVIDGNRPTNWEASAALQHELVPGVSVSASYFRRWYQNLNFTENVAVTPADYDAYCITAPSDPRLPGGGGYPDLRALRHQAGRAESSA